MKSSFHYSRNIIFKYVSWFFFGIGFIAIIIMVIIFFQIIFDGRNWSKITLEIAKLKILFCIVDALLFLFLSALFDHLFRTGNQPTLINELNQRN